MHRNSETSTNDHLGRALSHLSARAVATALLVCLLLAALFCAEWDSAQGAEYDPVPPGAVGGIVFTYWSEFALLCGFVLKRWRWTLLPVLPMAAISLLVALDEPYGRSTLEPYERWDPAEWWPWVPIYLSLDVGVIALGCALRRLPWHRLREIGKRVSSPDV